MEVATHDISFVALTVLNVVWSQRRFLFPRHLRTSFDVYINSILMIGHAGSSRSLFEAKIVQSFSVCLGFEVKHAYFNSLYVGLASALSTVRVIN
jgi:hypothetical protein